VTRDVVLNVRAVTSFIFTVANSIFLLQFSKLESYLSYIGIKNTRSVEICIININIVIFFVLIYFAGFHKKFFCFLAFFQ